MGRGNSANQGAQKAALTTAWDQMSERAKSFDEDCADRTKSSVSPIMADLVRAARRTELTHFYPFTSHAVLRFSTAPPPGGEEPPVAIGLCVQPDEYAVWWGWGDAFVLRGSAHIQLLTTDAEEAVALAALLVSGWESR